MILTEYTPGVAERKSVWDEQARYRCISIYLCGESQLRWTVERERERERERTILYRCILN